MADPYLDYLAAQDATLARQEDEIIALRGKLQAARETYEAFLESSSPVIAVPREDHVRANASRITSTGEQETANGSDHTQDGMPATGEYPPRRPDRDGEGGHPILRVRDRQNHADSQRRSEEEASAQAAIGAEPSYGEPVPKSAAREAQPADEPYDPGPMPGFLRKERA